jgi:ABC-type uncharacterized transport system ATPase subunit
MFVFSTNERAVKAEAKNNWNIGLKVRNSRLVEQEIQELSKGMAQKIQFVVCVLHKPKLLILTNLFWF